jgi:hypothetical protein
VVLKKMLLLWIRSEIQRNCLNAFDVPVGDPGGSYGCNFPDATGRNLTGYDALTSG